MVAPGQVRLVADTGAAGCSASTSRPPPRPAVDRAPAQAALARLGLTAIGWTTFAAACPDGGAVQTVQAAAPVEGEPRPLDEVLAGLTGPGRVVATPELVAFHRRVGRGGDPRGERPGRGHLHHGRLPLTSPAAAVASRSVSRRGLGAVGEGLLDEARRAGDAHARHDVLGRDARGGRRTACTGHRAAGQHGREQVGQRRGVRQLELVGPAGQREPGRLAGQPQRHRDAGRDRGRRHRERLGAPLRRVGAGGGLDDEGACHDRQHRHGRHRLLTWLPRSGS